MNFESFDLTDSNTISFDGGKYWIHIHTLGKMFAGVNLELSDDKTIEKTLNKNIKTDNFNKPLKEIIYEYCEYRNITNYWDMAGKAHIIIFNNDSLEGYLQGMSIREIIEEVDEGYAKLNEPLDKSGFKSAYYSIRRIFNSTSNSPVESLLKYLLKSDLTLKNKLELKKKISTGSISNEASLKKSIKANSKKNTDIARKKIPTRNRKVHKTNSKKYSSKLDLIECPYCKELNDKDATLCKICHYTLKQDKTVTKGSKKKSKNKIKNQNKDDLIECPHCKELNDKDAVRCKLCYYEFKQDKTVTEGSKKKSKNKIKNQNKDDLIECPHCKELNDKDAVRCKLCHYEFKQDDAILDLIKCPNCGELIKKNAIRCKYCNYYFKQEKVLPKTNIKKEKKINTNNQHNGSNIQSGKKICPNCGELNEDYDYSCVKCDYPLKNQKMNTKKNIKFCCDCHNEINLAATKCTDCGSKSFVYNRCITKLKSFIIKYDVRAENQWQYIQITDDNDRYTIFAKSKRELKNKVVENYLPWDDKKIDTKINVGYGTYYPKKQSKYRKGYHGDYYEGYDYENGYYYEESPSFLYYERDNTTEEDLGYFR